MENVEGFWAKATFVFEDIGILEISGSCPKVPRVDKKGSQIAPFSMVDKTYISQPALTGSLMY